VADLGLGQSVGYQVRMTNRAFQARLKERVEPFGVSSGMWYFLRLLWQSDGQTQSALSRQIGLMEPTAVAALGSMERRGLIRRAKDETDRRKINVFLTDHGLALREQMLPLAHEINAEGLKSLTQAERKTLLRLLKRIEADLLEKSRRTPGTGR
jgi:DNA-binding MarR family transcriptional regulator